LARGGYAPQHFTTPADFFSVLSQTAPELVVLDLSLGQSDAVEVMHQLREHGYRGKVLLVSGRDAITLADIQKVGAAHGLQMLPWLQKPFRPADLRKCLAADVDAIAAVPAGIPSDIRKVDLAEALHNNWLELWYQPKIALKTHTICGAEALLRVRHPQFGILPPASVLPRVGDPLYRPLTHFVITRAMSDWKFFADQGQPLRLALNVPASVVQAPDFIAMVRDALPKHPKFPGLIVEITEDEIISDPQQIREVATRLKLYDVCVAVDDFGTAYSSLSRLRDLPCAEVKLDRSFVFDCAADMQKKLLCKAAVELAHGFGLSICAEGVENEADRDALVEFGCDTAQGYLFARPMDVAIMARMLAAQGVDESRGSLCEERSRVTAA
jgi:EAL domain-containing protein (putative c-di-GMP-specific phosphodiesterase class I)